MELSQETDDYIRESIEHSLGLPISRCTLEFKLQVYEQALLGLGDHYLCLRSKLNEKDEIIERARAESSMNAIALKKFVDENQKLSMECLNLLARYMKWKRECSLYEHDREVLMDFGNEADGRAKEAEIRALELEEEVDKLSEELQFYKYQFVQKEAQLVDVSTRDASTEQDLLESLLAEVAGQDEDASRVLAFLESNSSLESCQELTKMWDRLSPSTCKVLALAAKVKSLQKDKEHMLNNLRKAEEEVEVLSEENNILDEENKRLTRQHHKDKHPLDYSGKISGSISSKGSKRKSSPKVSSPIEKRIDFE